MKKFIHYLLTSTYLFMISTVCAQKPLGLPLHTPWEMSSDTWDDTGENNSEETLKKSIFLIYNTLFSNHFSNPYFEVSEEERFKEHQKITFLKKLYLLLILSELQYTPIDNNPETTPWPFPMATVLTQGQRVMITVRHGLPFDAFLAYLTGDSGMLIPRSYSSHGARCDTSICIEVKIKNPAHQKSGADAIDGTNYGINIPLGGIGNPLPNGDIIGPGGTQFSTKHNKFMPNRQLGHILVYVHDFPKLGISVILIGLEGCAPGTHNLFKSSHNILSGIQNQQKRPAATGGRKWSGINFNSLLPPAEYGGKRIDLTRKSFLAYKEKISRILSLPHKEQQKLFKHLLSEDGPGALETLNKTLAQLNEYYPDE